MGILMNLIVFLLFLLLFFFFLFKIKIRAQVLEFSDEVHTYLWLAQDVQILIDKKK